MVQQVDPRPATLPAGARLLPRQLLQGALGDRGIQGAVPGPGQDREQEGKGLILGRAAKSQNSLRMEGK